MAKDKFTEKQKTMINALSRSKRTNQHHFLKKYQQIKHYLSKSFKFLTTKLFRMRPLRVLCLHGYRQSGDQYRVKERDELV